jgi:hypothetical protein
MKPEIKLFKILDDDSKFLQWKDHLIARCYGTSLSECCDFDYIPSPADEESFENKDRWLYAILLHIVKTPDGIDILRKHREGKSGRAVFHDLISDHAESATADIRSTEILEEITNMRLDSTWDKSIREFILSIERLIEEYNESVRYKTQQLNPDMKRAMVE